MPSALTIFVAQNFIYIDLVVAAIVALWLLYAMPREDAVWWGVACAFILVLGEVGAKIGASLYRDPRPFTVDHVKPLISHAADNGFPSDHALLAALIVAGIGLLSIRWAVPFVVFAVLIDWARVGAGIHHLSDVIGSSVIVAVVTLIAVSLARPVSRMLLPHVPQSFLQLGVTGEGAHPVSPTRR